MSTQPEKKSTPRQSASKPKQAKSACPVCGGPLQQEKCKVVCRSTTCVYRIIYNCSEF